MPDDATPSRTAPADSRSLVLRGLHVMRVALTRAPRQFTFGITGALVFAGMTVLSSVVLGRVTDEIITPALDQGVDVGSTLWLGVGAIAAVGLFKGIGVVGRRLGAYAAQYKLQADHRRAITRRYLELPTEWHRRHTTGELMSNANADVESAFFVAAPLPMAIAALSLLLGTVGLLVATDPLLAAIGFTVAPLLVFVNSYFLRRMRVAATLAQQSRADVSEVAHESFDAAIVVKTMGREADEVARFRADSERLRDRMTTFGRIRAKFDPLMEALPNLAILAVLFVGARRVADGVLTPGDLVQFAYLFRLVALPVRVFGWLFGELPRAVVGFDRVDRVLSTEGRVSYGAVDPDGEGGVSLDVEGLTYEHPHGGRETLGETTDEALLRLVGLESEAESDAGAGTEPGDRDEPAADRATESGARGVRELEFDVQPGRTIAVVGPTGSGKSTAAALLVRLLDPQAGRVAVGDVDLRDLDRHALSRDTSIVFQEAFVFDDTVAGNIALGLDVPHEQVVEAARLAGADGFVRELPDGYETQVGERGSTLSGGQRQRIALARALLRRPRLLVLDDATSAVDPAVEAEILANLRSAALPSTVVIVAYRNGSIALADEVVFVDEGRVVARGSHQQLRETVPAYERLVSAYETEPAA